MRTRAHLLPILLGLWVVCTSARPKVLHDFHTSLTQMQLDPSTKTFEISVRVFVDDLERVLSREEGKKIQLTSNQKQDPLLEKYIRSHFGLVTLQKQRKPFTFVGHEPEGDAIWIYLEMPYSESMRAGILQQDVLMEMFDDQVNLVNLLVGGQRKTYVFRKGQPTQEIAFQ